MAGTVALVMARRAAVGTTLSGRSRLGGGGKDDCIRAGSFDSHSRTVMASKGASR